jgi:putative peptidoglycan lipid II flippase
MSKLVKSSLQISLWTGISKIFGLFRDLTIASAFGIGDSADVVNVVLKMPNFFRRIFAEGALSNVFIPIFNQKVKVSQRDAEDFANHLLMYLVGIVLILVIFMELIMPYVVMVVAPGFVFDAEKMSNVVFLCRISMPCLICITTVGLFGSILNSQSRFFAFSMSPIIMSLCVICASKIYHVNAYGKAFYVAFGLLIAGILQVIFLCIFLARYEILVPRYPKISQKDNIFSFLRNLWPAALSSSANQLQIVIFQSIASFFSGSISILTYSERLYQAPLSILGTAFSNAVLPELTFAQSKDGLGGVSATHNRALKIAWLFSVHSTVILILLALPIVSLAYERGSFIRTTSFAVSNTVILFSFGVPAVILSKLFNNLFYIYQNTAILLRITLISLSANVILVLCLIKFMGYLGIPIGSSIANWLNLILLVWYSSKKGYFVFSRKLFRWFGEVLLIGLIMGVVIYFTNKYLKLYWDGDLFMSKLALLASVSIIGSIVYLFGAIVSKKIAITTKARIRINIL